MTIYLYNTLTQDKQVFTPLQPDRVTLYVCGPTVYNLVHIGNARPVVVFDVLYRLLRSHYPKVIYARNITDVDDKINKAAAQNGETIGELTRRYTQAFHADIARLNTLPPDVEPRATEHIPAMIKLIESLIERGHAYVADQHVLFRTSSDPTYGCLSKRHRDDLLDGARVEQADYKQDQADFVLWKPSTEDLPGWDSPWGRGRPGWHIECTAMINQHLGPSIDIHAGGQDLIFPHHENEIAQGRCAHDIGSQSYVNYWLHNGYLTLNGEKMAKSVGNFVTLRALLENWPGEAIRYALLTAHYRKPLEWSDVTLQQARASLDTLYGALRGGSTETWSTTPSTHAAISEIDTLLCDDLSTPQALAVLHRLAGEINRAEVDARAPLQTALRQAGAQLGLLWQEAESWFRWQPAQSSGLSDAQIENLIAQRLDARKQKDFALADRIRDELRAKGIELEDTRSGTRWSRN